MLHNYRCAMLTGAVCCLRAAFYFARDIPTGARDLNRWALTWTKQQFKKRGFKDRRIASNAFLKFLCLATTVAPPTGLRGPCLKTTFYVNNYVVRNT